MAKTCLSMLTSYCAWMYCCFSQTICVISGSYGPSLALIGKSTHVVLYGK